MTSQLAIWPLLPAAFAPSRQATIKTCLACLPNTLVLIGGWLTCPHSRNEGYIIRGVGGKRAWLKAQCSFGPSCWDGSAERGWMCLGRWRAWVTSQAPGPRRGIWHSCQRSSLLAENPSRFIVGGCTCHRLPRAWHEWDSPKEQKDHMIFFLIFFFVKGHKTTPPARTYACPLNVPGASHDSSAMSSLSLSFRTKSFFFMQLGKGRGFSTRPRQMLLYPPYAFKSVGALILQEGGNMLLIPTE